MAISCTPSDLVQEAKCFQCLPNRTQDSVEIYLLCAWEHGGIAPEEQIILGDPEMDFMFGNPDEGWVFGN